jgi:hypothetical protein
MSAGIILALNWGVEFKKKLRVLQKLRVSPLKSIAGIASVILSSFKQKIISFLVGQVLKSHISISAPNLWNVYKKLKGLTQ